jgi:hypothetical protein
MRDEDAIQIELLERIATALEKIAGFFTEMKE